MVAPCSASDRQPHGGVEARLSDLGRGYLSGLDQPQGGLVHEAASGLGDHAKIRVARASARKAFENGEALFTGPVEADGHICVTCRRGRRSPGVERSGKPLWWAPRIARPGREHGRPDPQGLHRRARGPRRDGLHGRGERLSGDALRSRVGQSQRQRVRPGHGPHERNRIVLVHVEAGLSGNLPPLLGEAS